MVYLRLVRLSLALALLLAVAVFRAAPVTAVEQAIQPLAPPVEQQIEILTTTDDQQRVEVVGEQGEQVVGEHVPPTPTEKAASQAGKFMLGVASAGVALGVMAASLLLL